MCGDSHLPPAPSLGDAVAVIRLQPQLGAITSMPESSWRLQLSNRLATEEEDNTKLIYEAKPDWWCDDVKLRIQYVTIVHLRNRVVFQSFDESIDG